MELELGDEAVIPPWYLFGCVRGGLDALGIRLGSTGVNVTKLNWIKSSSEERRMVVVLSVVESSY